MVCGICCSVAWHCSVSISLKTQRWGLADGKAENCKILCPGLLLVCYVKGRGSTLPFLIKCVLSLATLSQVSLCTENTLVLTPGSGIPPGCRVSEEGPPYSREAHKWRGGYVEGCAHPVPPRVGLFQSPVIERKSVRGIGGGAQWWSTCLTCRRPWV